MCNDDKNQISVKEKARFWRVIFTAVAVCLVGMISCCIWFCWTSAKFSAECDNILNTISSNAASDNACATSAPISIPTSAPSSIPSPTSSSASTSDSSADKNERIESLIKHMESMVAIQKSGMTNDLMSFIYGILSAVLVGLCAAFVVKSRTSADEAKKTANDAKDNAYEAKEQAREVQRTAKDTEEAINKVKVLTDEAKRNAEAAKEQAKVAQDKAKDTEKAIEEAQTANDKAQNAANIAQELQYQVKLLIISDRIVSAKAALLMLNHISANKAIKQIRAEIISLFSDDEVELIMKSSDSESMGIGKIYEEMCDLDSTIDIFENECKKTYAITSKEATESEKREKQLTLETMEIAANNYHKWIKDAIKCLDAFINRTKNPAR